MFFIHSTSEVQTDKIGKNICVWQYSIILAKAQIGDNCKIGCNVFIDANTVFCNDRYPKVNNKNFKLEKIVIEDNVSIGANVTILPGVRIGKSSIVGTSSVVVKDIDENSVVVGNLARKIRDNLK